MIDDQQPIYGAPDIQALITNFLNANPQEEQQMIVANGQVLLSDNVLVSLRSSVAALEQKLLRLEELRREYTQNTEEEYQSQIDFLEHDIVDNVNAAETVAEQMVGQEPDQSDAQREEPEASMDTSQQSYIPRSEAEVEAMFASMTSEQLAQALQMMSELDTIEMTQMMQMIGEAKQLDSLQLNILHTSVQQLQNMKPEEMHQFAERVKEVQSEQDYSAEDAFQKATQMIRDAQMEQVTQNFRNLDMQQLAALAENASQSGLVGDGQKDMVLRILKELQEAGDNQLQEFMDIILKAQLTGEPIDTGRLQELQLPLMKDAQRAAQEPEQAIRAYTQELTTVTREQNPFQWARWHYLRGGAYQLSREGNQNANLELALEDFNTALDVFTYENAIAEWGTVLIMRAALYMERKQGDVIENCRLAVADFEEGMRAFTPEIFPVEWARGTLGRGIAYLSLSSLTGDRGTCLENAIVDCNDALSVFTYEQYPEDWRRAMVTRCAAHCMCDTSNPQQHREQALIDANMALEVITKDQFPDDWASLHCHRAIAYWQRIAGDKQQNLDRAMADCEAALTIYSMQTYPNQRVMILNNRAMIRMEHGHGDLGDSIEQSINDQLEVLNVLQKETRPLEWAQAHLSCAVLYMKRLMKDNQQNLRMAYGHCTLALEVFTPEQTPVWWGKTLVRRGLACYGKLPEEIHQVLENRLGLVHLVTRGPKNLLQNFKNSYEVYRAAYDDFDLALTVLTEENAPADWALAHSERANAYEIMNMQQSPESHKQAKDDREQAATIITLESRPLEWAAIQTQQASSLLLLPINQTQEALKLNAQEALTHIDKVLKIFTAEVSPRNYQYARALQAIAYERLNDWEKAHRAWLEARKARRIIMSMALGEQSRIDQEIVLMNFNIYKHDAQALLRCTPPNSAEAVIALEEGRAQGLRQAFELDGLDPQKIENRQARKRAEILLAARERWRQSQQRVERLFTEKNIAEYSDERQLYIHDLQVAHEAFIQAGDAIRAYDNPNFLSPVPTFGSIAQAILESDEALVYLVAGSIFGAGITDNLFGVSADKGFALIVVRDVQGEPHIHALELPLLTGLTIDGLFHDTTTSRSRMPIDADHVLKQVGALGINDVVRVLQELRIRCVTFVPYGRLNLLPLAAIQVTSLTGKMGYLGDLFEVCVAPSARSCEISHRRAIEAGGERQRQGLCLVGNPFPLIDDLPALPQAEAEADTIKQMARGYGYPAAQIQHFSRADANKQKIVGGLDAAQYVHFAMHGVYDAANPLKSRLVLAGNGRVQEQERCLTLGEILQGTVSLTGVRLLVLSACDTSLVDLRRIPDEVVGLAAGFLQAGVAGVIASLWQVDETATYLLMVQFARQYLDPQGVRSPACALAQAQRWLRQEATNRVLASYDPLEDVIIPSLMSEASQMLYNKTLLKIHKQASGQMETAPDICPYADPQYWAAFMVTGC